MTREELLKLIAETGYNVGIGAKKHFSTYDIVEKVPGFINFLSIAFGIYALVFDSLSTKALSATLIVLGIISLYISFYDSKKMEYEACGCNLIQLSNELRQLYIDVKGAEISLLPKFRETLKALQDRYYNTSLSKQIMFSDWYAHYKFFWQHQIDWIDEQKNFKFFRDKVPLTVYLALLFIGVFFFFLFICA